MAVEVDHVIRAGPASAASCRAWVRRGSSCGAQNVQVQAGHLLGAAADQPGGHRPERHILPGPRVGR